jgi:thiol-disulfide isomerase/thioredoxin
MIKKIMNYGKSLLKGIIIALVVILLYTVTDFIYFNNQLLFADYIDAIKVYIVAGSVILYIGLLYLFYSKIKNRRTIDLVLMLTPYFLILLTTMLISKNIPRLLDFFYILLGIILVFFQFKENTIISKRKYFIILFFIFTVLSYPYLYNNISYNYNKPNDESIAVVDKFNFIISDTAGKKCKISDFKSKAVCIDMWSSTCGGCIKSMPEFEKLNMYFKENTNFKIISLFCPMKEHETYEWFKNYVRNDFKYNIDYYYIEKDQFKKLGIYQFPEFFLINRNNIIVYRGSISYDKSVYDNIYEKLKKISDD